MYIGGFFRLALAGSFALFISASINYISTNYTTMNINPKTISISQLSIFVFLFALCFWSWRVFAHATLQALLFLRRIFVENKLLKSQRCKSHGIDTFCIMYTKKW
jgi:hypothetical protein